MELEKEIAELSAKYVEDSEKRKQDARDKTAKEAKEETDAQEDREEAARIVGDARREIDRNIIESAAEVTQAVIDNTEEESAAQRAALIVQRSLAIAGTVIDTQERISAITAASGEMVKFLSPIIGPAAIPVAAALTATQIAFAVTQGAARVAALSGIQFEEGGPTSTALAKIGGLASGPSHSQGGIPGVVQGAPIEFEGGEYIVRKEATQRNQDIINTVNEDAGKSRFGLVKLFAKGGVTYSPSRRVYEGGGALTTPAAKQIEREALAGAEIAEIVRATVAGMPSPQVSVTEIAEVGRKVSIKEGRAKL